MQTLQTHRHHSVFLDRGMERGCIMIHLLKGGITHHRFGMTHRHLLVQLATRDHRVPSQTITIIIHHGGSQ